MYITLPLYFELYRAFIILSYVDFYFFIMINEYGILLLDARVKAITLGVGNLFVFVY